MKWQYATSAAFSSVIAACCAIVCACRSTGQRKLFLWPKTYKFAATVITQSWDLSSFAHSATFMTSLHPTSESVSEMHQHHHISETCFLSSKKKWPTNDKQDPNKNPNCLASGWPVVLTLYFDKTRLFTWTLADVYCKKKCHEVNEKFSSPVWLFIKVTVVLKLILLCIGYLQDSLFFPKVVFHCH